MDKWDTYENVMLDIQRQQYQFAHPRPYNGDTNGAKYVIDTEWHSYYSVDWHKNYFDVEDEIEALKRVRDDLANMIAGIDKELDKKVKVLKK